MRIKAQLICQAAIAPVEAAIKAKLQPQLKNY